MIYCSNKKKERKKERKKEGKKERKKERRKKRKKERLFFSLPGTNDQYQFNGRKIMMEINLFKGQSWYFFTIF
jgi:hypothetical protein